MTSCRRPLLQHSTSLPDRQPRPGSPSGEPIKDAPSFIEAVPSEQHLLNPLPIPAPLLDLVEVATAGEAGVVGFFVGTSCQPRLPRTRMFRWVISPSRRIESCWHWEWVLTCLQISKRILAREILQAIHRVLKIGLLAREERNVYVAPFMVPELSIFGGFLQASEK
jgi:hypothetical protein